jgi:HD-GYP domain-containing protein (c-di-GMP phosphodiesterase class II)
MLQAPHLDLPGTLESPARAAVTVLLHQLAASLGKAIDAKDPHTLAHSEEVAVVSQALALAMGLDSRLADNIHVAGHLHDIGKLGVPDAVLGKPDALDPWEWECMKAHPSRGADILAPLTCLTETGITAMVRAHHERYDGRGYPLGLTGRSIPLGARIIAVADSLSAMVQSRPYRPARTFEAAIAEIVRCRGSQFDPAVVDACRGILGPLRDMIEGYRRAPMA